MGRFLLTEPQGKSHHIYIYIINKYSYLFITVLCVLQYLRDPSQGLNLCPLQWKCGVLTTGQPGNSLQMSIFCYLTNLFLDVLGLLCGVRASHCSGFPCGAQAVGTRAPGVVGYRPCCSDACGIFPDQGLNLCPLHWQALYPLYYQGGPLGVYFQSRIPLIDYRTFPFFLHFLTNIY